MTDLTKHKLVLETGARTNTMIKEILCKCTSLYVYERTQENKQKKNAKVEQKNKEMTEMIVPENLREIMKKEKMLVDNCLTKLMEMLWAENIPVFYSKCGRRTVNGIMIILKEDKFKALEVAYKYYGVDGVQNKKEEEKKLTSETQNDNI